MSRIIRVETKDGVTEMTVEVETDPSKVVPPPEGWQRTGGAMAGNEACIIEDLLVRGMDRANATGMFATIAPEVRRQDVSHEQDAAGIVEHCRKHGIRVEAGEIIDETDGVRMDGAVRVFRGWRMTGEGCSWGTTEYHLRTNEAGQRVCAVCGQEPKAGL